MNPIREALGICESMMLNKSLAGIGRLHRLLSLVQDNYFLDEQDDAIPLVEDDVTFAALGYTCRLCGKLCYPWENTHKACMDHEAMLAPPVNSPDEE